MYAVPVGAILEATIRGSLASQTTLSLFHYMLNDTAIPDGAAFLTTFNTAFNIAGGVVDKYRLCCCEDFTLNEVRYQWIYPTRFRSVSFAPFIGTGSIVDQSAPPNVAQVVTKRADVASRRGIGTLHVPSVPNAQIADGKLLGGQLTRLSALGTALSAALVTARMDPVLLRRDLPAASPIITSTVAQETVRVERRRTVGLGI